MPRPPTPDPLPVLGIMNTTGFRISSHSLSFGVAMAPNSNENGQFYHSSRNGASQTAQCPRAVLQAQVGEPTTHPPPHHQYNKSLKDPVRGAGSAQVQIRSYRNRQSGNLARKVRNSFSMCKALNEQLEDLIIDFLHAGAV